eukprot:m.171236 g.171236  ORF g.171236 m.171236 type:complete len:254 (+) comp13349_c0_seq1:248-1009(+)
MLGGEDDTAPPSVTLEQLAAHDLAYDDIEAGRDPSDHIQRHRKAPGWLDRIHPCGKTLLRCAVDHRRHAVITSLVSAGASPTASDLYGINPLHAACQQGDAVAVSAILDALPPHWTQRVPQLLATVDQEGSTPLHAAGRGGSVDVIHRLVRISAQVGATDAIGSTPLHVAAEAGYAEAVNALVAAGAQVDARNSLGNTPLHRAARHGLADAVQMLVDHGADPTARNDEGLTPFDLAQRAAHAEGLGGFRNDES